ncbi:MULTISPECIES: type II toxin-antitoxin system MqsR family toxin [Pseudomonas]|jgi:motility quorum-sensing regulator/GCU-specific mRNA interferase toxin|uniref:Type II toxin-antitoxin system MqsR family toxin n=1 Tax=Pseudomonas sp. W17 TaxID=3144407 RepID=A0AAU7X080_9PSED|nr:MULTISPECIES: type II toxin-antitoxin system MqsR family toxin [Pseudomonas]MBB1616141.1 motility quorum-sensing regulator MqsR [Pseudomonas sp. UMC65]MBB1620118.1 motility quorum-sensing regulator MqsR [Pseudomonas sp. UME65]MCD9569649.1 type II toxin-antitoxin system MqsR family toxin [Pseudomonas protegens]WRV92682.1 type II toxin-antitoxin system MqsR family toxin [Pseudomonas protegens]BAO60437.1 motility quorum-sensing regulator MqsR [Pseudomonas protegens Cab57]
MEKKTPHYDLSLIKAQVVRQGAQAFTRSALLCGKELGLSLAAMQRVIAGLQGSMFYKSMTTYGDHRLWQDVYYTRIDNRTLYIKVTYRPGAGPPVISFKEAET